MYQTLKTFHVFLLITIVFTFSCSFIFTPKEQDVRERISINDNWKFMKYEHMDQADSLIYDVRPKVKTHKDDIDADSKPTEAVEIKREQSALKPWILPTANPFIKSPDNHYPRPTGNPGHDFPFVQKDFDDSGWQTVDCPHDWGITGPFLEGCDAEVGGGMGRLASHGVAWYRKSIDIPTSDFGKSIFLDIDGAMSYAMVWFNGNLIGGWPYGYNSWRLDLTPYIEFGTKNQLAIRVDNPPHSARWYPGGGLYRNIWLTKTSQVHVAHWGTRVNTPKVTQSLATVEIDVTIDNDSEQEQTIGIITEIYAIDNDLNITTKVATVPIQTIKISTQNSVQIGGSVEIANPNLWGPPPSQEPNLYKAITSLYIKDEKIDEYITTFGIRSLECDPDKGVIVNGEHVRIQGVNQHHDLGALGAAFNTRAAERQLELLQELGCNAIRMAHNPPAPELLDLTDRMGFLVVDEVFDVWERKKTPLDFHLIFPEWYEADIRSFIRRDKNHPSVIMWSYGNEVGEQYTDKDGAALSKKLHDIVKDEDPTRPTTVSMNFAKPHMPFSEVADVISLNYQGEGIRDAKAYSHLRGIRTSPLYPAFRKKYPQKVIVSSETASTLSTRGTYLFPVHEGISAPAEDGSGGDPETAYVNAYEIYTAPFGASPDKVFKSQDNHPYVSGEFVWTGWDYLGEPTPYYSSRSSYFGIIDLAGFKKDRFYIYQARWRPDLPMVHILPHWNWPGRVGQITPVHVITSGDEAELFFNEKSLGKKKRGQFDYRLRWDDVVYQPGELKAVTFKDGKKWAETAVQTTGKPNALVLKADRSIINSNFNDLSFVTISIVDSNGNVVPTANNLVKFDINGPGEIVATDNGDPTDMTAFPSHLRNAFNGYALTIVHPLKGKSGSINMTASSEGLEPSTILIKLEK